MYLRCDELDTCIPTDLIRALQLRVLLVTVGIYEITVDTVLDAFMTLNRVSHNLGEQTGDELWNTQGQEKSSAMK